MKKCFCRDSNSRILIESTASYPLDHQDNDAGKCNFLVIIFQPISIKVGHCYNSPEIFNFDAGLVATHSFMLSFLAYEATFGQFEIVHFKCIL